MQERKAVIAEAVRTPFGGYFGSLSTIRPDDLLGFTLSSLMKKIPSLSSDKIDDVIIGDTNGAGEDNRNVARMGALIAGFAPTVPGVTLNRLCGSGAEAIVQASRAIRLGDAQYIIAGGVESMSRAPWIVERNSKKRPESIDPATLNQSTVGWRLINPKFSEPWTDSLGRCAEAVADTLSITRTALDEWALRSHQLAAAAWEKGYHDSFVVSLNNLTSDESIRRDTSLEILAALPSAFSVGGTGTAGNSSPINDGAVAMLITNEENCQVLGLTGIAQIIGSQVTATAPHEFTLAPVSAIRKLLHQMDRKVSEITLWEINEAFAAVVLTVLHEIPEIDVNRVNVNGGSIAIGHPVGASASRVIVDCARELKRRGGGIGIVAACIGVGLGIAIAIEVPA